MMNKSYRAPTWLWVGLASVSLLAACAEEMPPERAPVVRPVKTLMVDAGDGAPLSFPGRVKASNQVDVSFRVGGPLVELPVREGDVVRRDGLIARIDPRDYRVRLDAARADFERAEADLQRFSALYEKEAVSQAQLDQARAARDVANAAVEDAKSALDDTYLRAPFAGRIGERFVENFEVVQPKQRIVSLIDISNVDIVFDAPENLLARVSGYRSNQAHGRIVARFDTAPGHEYDLTLKEVATQADPRSQTYRVTFTMRQPQELNVLPGMTGIIYRYPIGPGAAAAVVIPAAAVFSDEAGNPQVWAVETNGMTVTKRSVTTGELTGTDGIRILDGLSPGETIVVTGVNRLREGDEIRRLSDVEGYER